MHDPQHISCALPNGGREDIELLTQIALRRRGSSAARRLAVRLLARFGCVGAVLRAEPGEWFAVGGMDAGLAAELVHLNKLMIAVSRRQPAVRPVLENREAVIEFCRMQLAHQKREQLHGLFLDADYRLIRHACLQAGTVDHVTVYPREIVAQALALDACGIILAHNHPSGRSRPSAGDREITRKLERLCRELGLELVDHIIIAAADEFSFREAGELRS